MRKDIRIFTSLSFFDFISFDVKINSLNRIIFDDFIDKLNKINSDISINLDHNNNTIYFSSSHGKGFLDLNDKPFIRNILKLYLLLICCIAYPVISQKKRLFELAQSSKVIKIEQSSINEFENYIEEISNSIIGDIFRDILSTCIYDGWLFIDQKTAIIVFHKMPVIVDRLHMLLELESEKTRKNENFIGKIITSYNYKNTSNGGYKKAENAKRKSDPIRMKAIEMYKTPKASNREKWKSRNEFSRYFCIKHNADIKDETKWIKESAVNKWIKDLLENG